MADIDTPKSSPSSQPKQPDEPMHPEDVETFENIPLTKKIYLPANTPIYSFPNGAECARYDKPALFHVLRSPADTPKGWHRIGTSQGKEMGWTKNAIKDDPESNTHMWPTRLAIRMHPEKSMTDTNNWGVNDDHVSEFWSDEHKPIHFPVDTLSAAQSFSDRTYAEVGKPLRGELTIVFGRNTSNKQNMFMMSPTYPLKLQPNVNNQESEPLNELGYLVPRVTLDGATRIAEETGEKMETMLKMDEWNDTDYLRDKLESLARIELLLVTGDMPPGSRGSDKTAKMIEHLQSMQNPYRVQAFPILLTEGPDTVAAKATESKTNFDVYLRYFKSRHEKMVMALRKSAAESMYEDGREQSLIFIRPNELP